MLTRHELELSDGPGLPFRERESLLGILQVLNSSLDLGEMMHLVSKRVSQSLQVDRCSILLFSPDLRQALVLASEDALVRDITISLAKYPEIREVVRTGRPFIAHRVEEHGVLSPVLQVFREKSIQSLAVFPIVGSQGCEGVLFVRSQGKSFSPGAPDIFFVNAIAGAIALLVHNVRSAEALAGGNPHAVLNRLWAQERLASLQPYRAFFENAADGFFIVDRRGAILFANRSGAAMLGRSVEEIIFRPLFELVDPPAAEQLTLAVTQAGLAGSISDTEVVLQRFDGSQITLSIHTGSPPNDPSVVLLSSRDVSEERRIAHDHRRIKQFLEALIDSSVDAIVAADSEGMLILFNKGAERILGYEASDVIGRMTIGRLFPAGIESEMLTLFDQLKNSAGHRLTSTRKEVVSKNGEVIPIALTAWGVSEDGHQVATAVVLADLRDRLRIERKLNQAQERLMNTEKQAMIAELAGATAHELNQPLTSVLGYVELAKRKLPDGNDIQRVLDIVIREAERMAEIVRKIGNITRYETKTYVGEQRIVDLDRSSDPEDD